MHRGNAGISWVAGHKTKVGVDLPEARVPGARAGCSTLRGVDKPGS